MYNEEYLVHAKYKIFVYNFALNHLHIWLGIDLGHAELYFHIIKIKRFLCPRILYIEILKIDKKTWSN